ncbi:low-specificity L-threonine aldolase [Bacillus cytotoxicus]|uniref:low-specificity L-threonine aldolase n=1 Tax=Bacillus cereus group sp. BfR-BA-01492 TaxID=2920361 RepID=UPI001F5ABCE5|nr:low-specificity L-threonine aldolase [Bacillus cereus group sp. BfR-BA-01492]EMA6342455.1 low-specificity L-threonine aldolase [Bacillus cytotoxicus]
MKTLINYLSDTVTLPTEEMLKAIQNAELGDDVYGQDKTVNQLEGYAANMLGMESACFMPSGTMANLASILAHCPRGSTVLVGDESDIYIYEAGGAAICGGLMYQPIKTQPDGRLLLSDLEAAFPNDVKDPQFALPALICLENTHNRCGGKVLPLKYLKEIKEFAMRRNIPVHMDGARVFNAAVYLGVEVKEIAQYVDSIQFCLSKGLSAPIGSIVVGSRKYIEEVRRIRKMLGGGMRQVGIIAAPAMVALQTMTLRLQDDHIRAKRLAVGLANIDGIEVDASEIQTNIVMFRITDPNYNWVKFLKKTEEKGIIFSEMGYGRMRAVVHRHIKESDIEHTIEIIADLLNKSSVIK